PIKAGSDCKPGRHIGNVAIGGDFAYAITHTFTPSCSNGGGNNMAQLPSAVYQFSKTGGPPMKIGDAGSTAESGGIKPRVAASATDAVWLFDPGAQTIQISSKNGTLGGSVAPTGPR